MLKQLLFEMDQYEEEEELFCNNLIRLLRDNPNLTDDQVHQFAADHNVHYTNVEEKIYAMLSSLLNSIGKHNDTPDEDFDQDQLETGIEVEMEHTNDPLIAKMIAKDHLAELPDYYDRLAEMEQVDRSEEIE